MKLEILFYKQGHLEAVMMAVRKAGDRGHADRGWLKSWHTFSFADYYDPKQMAFRVLRVINEDFIEGGMGFGTHPHRDMEIVTYVIDGELAHKDTLGNAATIKPGEIQRMSAGTGIQHSEFNPLPDKKTHLLQIWLLPAKTGVKPGYEQKDFTHVLQKHGLHKVVSGAGGEDMVTINQDADIYVGKMENSTEELPLRPGRHAWIQMVDGLLEVKGFGPLQAGDGLAVSEERLLAMQAVGPAEFLLFDLP